MEQLVIVKQVGSDGTALVSHTRQSACSGDCHKCSGCGAASETMVLKVRNPIGAKPGDLVRLESASGPVLRAAAVMYLAPVALFFLGYLVGAVLWSAGAFTGGVCFALGIGLAVFYDRKVAGKRDPGYTITGFAEDRLLKSDRKGDNNID